MTLVGFLLEVNHEIILCIETILNALHYLLLGLWSLLKMAYVQRMKARAILVQIFGIFYQILFYLFMDPKMNVLGVHPLIISTMFILLTVAIANLARKIINSIYKEPSMVKYLILEGLATAELCACCFELIIVSDNWGVWTYGLYLFVLTVIWSRTWGDATACPYSPMEDLLEGKIKWQQTAMTIVAQLLGGALIYSYVYGLWALELVETHKGRAFEDCAADLQVPVQNGLVIEAVGTALCRLTSRYLATTSAPNAGMADAFFSTMMVVAAFDYTGGYFNPALATSLKFGCDGETLTEFLLVYWVGSCLGSIASAFIFNSKPIQTIVYGPDKVREREVNMD